MVYWYPWNAVVWSYRSSISMRHLCILYCPKFLWINLKLTMLYDRIYIRMAAFIVNQFLHVSRCHQVPQKFDGSLPYIITVEVPFSNRIQMSMLDYPSRVWGVPL
jgi:hypothetical protein